MGKRVSSYGGQKKGPVEDGSMWIHPKMTGGSLAAARSLRKVMEKSGKSAVGGLGTSEAPETLTDRLDAGHGSARGLHGGVRW